MYFHKETGIRDVRLTQENKNIFNMNILHYVKFHYANQSFKNK